MSGLGFSAIMFVAIFGGALLGMALRTRLHDHHLAADSRDAVKVGMGFVGTMVALVLGLLVAAAKNSYDTQSTEVTEMSATIAVLDRVLAHYGPEANVARTRLRATAESFVTRMWSTERAGPGSAIAPSRAGEELFDEVMSLRPHDERQVALCEEARTLMMELARTRWLMYEQRLTGVSSPLLYVLLVWLSIIFMSFGLFAPRNPLVITSFFVSAVSVASAVLLILEMYTPFEGFIQISSEPVRTAISHLLQ